MFETTALGDEVMGMKTEGMGQKGDIEEEEAEEMQELEEMKGGRNQRRWLR